MNYQETLDYLYASLPMFSRLGSAAMKADLHNTLAFCEALGNPQHRFKSIHIAGTNGKGSVSHMLASVLHEAGYKTGLYTSPHLYDFRERIRIDNHMISEAFVVDFVARHKDLMESIQPSFFETTVAMAFQAFAEARVAVAVIETGLGGRLDSTNVITPVLSVITQIGMDHTQLLGNTLEAIAHEKAGIIKPGVPVVIGEKQDETEAVFINKARSTGSAIFFAEDMRSVVDFQPGSFRSSITVRDERLDLLEEFSLDLPGVYQQKNILTVLQAVEVLPGFDISEQALHKGLRNAHEKTGLMGRWECLRESPRVVLEVAHNPDGMRAMLHQLELETYGRLHLVLGMVRDKDFDTVLNLLPVTAQYYFTQSHIPRALPAGELREAASLHMLRGEVFEDVNAAVDAALRAVAPDDLIVVCGSIFLVAEVERKRFTDTRPR